MHPPQSPNKGQGGSIRSSEGTVSSRSGANHPYDAAIVWSDASTGFKVMASKSDEEQFKAAAAGKMKLDGMAFFAQWFNDGVKLVM